LITLAKRGDLHARRQALSIVREKEVVYKLFEEASEKYGAVSGGYTRIVKMGRRPGDAAPISMVELISVEKSKKKKKTKRKKKVKASAEKKQVVEKKEETTATEEDKAEEKTATLESEDAVQGSDITAEEQTAASDMSEATENDGADTKETGSKNEDTRSEK
jgi:large subunit ribosomal protein L17